MSDPALVTAWLSGLAALVGTFAAMFIQLRTIHRAVNSNMDKAVAEIRDLNVRLNEVAAGLGDPGPGRGSSGVEGKIVATGPAQPAVPNV